MGAFTLLDRPLPLIRFQLATHGLYRLLLLCRSWLRLPKFGRLLEGRSAQAHDASLLYRSNVP